VGIPQNHALGQRADNRPETGASLDTQRRLDFLARRDVGTHAAITLKGSIFTSNTGSPLMLR
jgi:hypothetical protein